MGGSGGRFMASHRAAAHKPLQAIGSVPVVVVSVVAPDSHSAPWYTDQYLYHSRAVLAHTAVWGPGF